MPFHSVATAPVRGPQPKEEQKGFADLRDDPHLAGLLDSCRLYWASTVTRSIGYLYYVLHYIVAYIYIMIKYVYGHATRCL